MIMGSLVLIKNAVGFTGIIVLLYLVLAPILKIVVFILALRFLAAVAEPIADKRISTALGQLAKNMSLLITSILGVSFMFFSVIMLVMMTGNVF